MVRMMSKGSTKFLSPDHSIVTLPTLHFSVVWGTSGCDVQFCCQSRKKNARRHQSFIPRVDFHRNWCKNSLIWLMIMIKGSLSRKTELNMFQPLQLPLSNWWSIWLGAKHVSQNHPSLGQLKLTFIPWLAVLPSDELQEGWWRRNGIAKKWLGLMKL